MCVCVCWKGRLGSAKISASHSLSQPCHQGGEGDLCRPEGPPLSLKTGPYLGKRSEAPPGRQASEALVSWGGAARALPAPQAPAPCPSSLALTAPGVLPQAEWVAVAALACSPLPLPCVYRVRMGPRRPGRSRLLSASCRLGRALRFCSKHGRRRGVWAPDTPAGRLRLFPPKPSEVEPQAALPARSPGQGAPRSPSDEALGVRTSRDEQVLCRGRRSWTQGSLSSCFPFKLKQDLPRLPHSEAVWGAGGR